MEINTEEKKIHAITLKGSKSYTLVRELNQSDYELIKSIVDEVNQNTDIELEISETIII